MTSKLEDVINDVINAWEALPGGTNYSPTQIAQWLSDDMAPAIQRARNAIGRKRPKGG
jgi:hypothetical protein